MSLFYFRSAALPGVTLTFAASAQPATVALTATNTPPAGSVTFAAAAQPAAGSFTLQNLIPSALVTLTGSAQPASASLTVTNTQPPGTITFAAAAQAAAGSFNALNVPPARTLTFAGQAQSAATAFTLTNGVPSQPVTLTAAAGSAAASFALAYLPPNSTLTFAAGAGRATVSFAVNNGTAVAGTILEAIRTRVVSDLTTAAFGAEVYNRKTPAKARIGFPCLVLNPVTEDVDAVTGGDYYPTWVEVQFTVLDADADAGVSLRDAVYKLFGPKAAPLTFADGNTTAPVHGRKWEYDQPGQGVNGNTVWAAAFSMRFYVTRSFLP